MALFFHLEIIILYLKYKILHIVLSFDKNIKLIECNKG